MQMRVSGVRGTTFQFLSCGFEPIDLAVFEPVVAAKRVLIRTVTMGVKEVECECRVV